MMRATLAVLFLLAAPAAGAWVPCEQKDITPPQPIQREAPPYPQAVRELGIEGTVEVALTVLRDGSVGWVRIVRAEPRGYFEQAAAEGVRRWRFSPAMQDGQAIECRLRTRVRFALTDAAATVEGLTSGDRPQPIYPAALLQARIEGYAEVEYDLDAGGAVKNAKLSAAMPRGEFEKAALAAVRGWHGPASESALRHETRRFDFRLPDTRLDVVPPTLLASAPFPMAACERHMTGRVVLEVETESSGQVLRGSHPHGGTGRAIRPHGAHGRPRIEAVAGLSRWPADRGDRASHAAFRPGTRHLPRHAVAGSRAARGQPPAAAGDAAR